jgi:DHA1 family bicyclomycin/chloramphenicol resistance-like MFS transporter
LLREPSALDKDHQKTLRNTFSNLKRLAISPGFALPLGIFAVAGIPILMFVGGAADIYISGFGVSEQMFSIFFGFNAAFYSLGPFVYIWMARRFRVPTLIGLSFVLSVASGLFVILFGHQSPYLLSLAVVPFALGNGINRPPGMNILLEQGKEDAGAASSLANFTFLVTGCLGILLISLDWDDRIFVLGLAYLVTGVFALLSWPSVWKKCNPAHIPKSDSLVDGVSPTHHSP